MPEIIGKVSKKHPKNAKKYNLLKTKGILNTEM